MDHPHSTIFHMYSQPLHIYRIPMDTYNADVASVFNRCDAKIRDLNLLEATPFVDVHGKSALM